MPVLKPVVPCWPWLDKPFSCEIVAGEVPRKGHKTSEDQKLDAALERRVLKHYRRSFGEFNSEGLARYRKELRQKNIDKPGSKRISPFP